jgi:hypothetical protein
MTRKPGTRSLESIGDSKTSCTRYCDRLAWIASSLNGASQVRQSDVSIFWMETAHFEGAEQDKTPSK